VITIERFFSANPQSIMAVFLTKPHIPQQLLIIPPPGPNQVPPTTALGSPADVACTMRSATAWRLKVSGGVQLRTLGQKWPQKWENLWENMGE